MTFVVESTVYSTLFYIMVLILCSAELPCVMTLATKYDIFIIDTLKLNNQIPSLLQGFATDKNKLIIAENHQHLMILKLHYGVWPTMAIDLGLLYELERGVPRKDMNFRVICRHFLCKQTQTL